MVAQLIDRITQIKVKDMTLKLRRAWPRSIDHLLIEYVDDDGVIVPGQWIADKDKLKRVYEQTQAISPDNSCSIVSINDIDLLLQPSGADRKLNCLSNYLTSSNATLISHRPERRAVVKLECVKGMRYAKLMKPGRIKKTVSVMNYLNDLPDRSFDVPLVLDSNEKDGVVVLSQLSGRSLNDSILDDEDLQTIKSIGQALRNLHETKPIDNAPVHDNEAEIEVLKKWINFTDSFGCTIADDVKAAAPEVYAFLSENSSDRVLLHRDFYDKQIIVDQCQKIGILDFDTLAIGEAALDLANAIVHFELRALQSVCSTSYSTDAIAELLAGYDPTPEVTKRIGAYKNAARLRLACVYSFRPNTHTICKDLLNSIASA